MWNSFCQLLNSHELSAFLYSMRYPHVFQPTVYLAMPSNEPEKNKEPLVSWDSLEPRVKEQEDKTQIEPLEARTEDKTSEYSQSETAPAFSSLVATPKRMPGRPRRSDSAQLAALYREAKTLAHSAGLQFSQKQWCENQGGGIAPRVLRRILKEYPKGH